jgi:hypothetical protein
MSRRMNSRSGTLWRVGLVGIVLFAIPFCLWSQAASSSKQSHAIAGQTFAGIGESLDRAADTLLASAVQTASPELVRTNVGKSPTTTFARRDDPLSRLPGGGGQSAAAIRVNLLRPAVDPILRSHGVPDDLAAVILVESGGSATALSPKGARGLWQLMPNTARRYGLRVDDIQDDRLDLFKATDAAAQYLHDLYGQFGDWKLALAAYNTGEANLGSAIERAHTQDFYQLTSLQMLPLETRNYVPRVLAAAQLFDRPSVLGEARSSNATTVFAVSNP